jgi:maleate cis-trans isomerase
MLGWKGRVGVIATDLEKRGACEFYKVAPDGLAYIVTNVSKEKGDLGSLEKAVKDLTGVGVDCLIYSCTGRVTNKTHGSEEELIKFIQDLSGKPATTTISASAEALQHLSIKRILLSGHSDTTSTNKLKDYFEGRGFAVPYTKSLESVEEIKKQIAATYGITKPGGSHFPDDLCYTQAMSAFRQMPSKDAVDGIYIPCATWSTHRYLNKVEEDTGLPVVATHRSNIWWVFKVLGLNGPIQGYGKLLESM